MPFKNFFFDFLNLFDRSSHKKGALLKFDQLSNERMHLFYNLPLPSNSGSQNFEKLSAALKGKKGERGR